ncbi:bolA-like protein 2 [Ptychodera flava]|uniref:bolA-like protein 2 n=1 Tax=Ptychodera flava TaxID=63121 RepID=UPI003969EA92
MVERILATSGKRVCTFDRYFSSLTRQLSSKMSGNYANITAESLTGKLKKDLEADHVEVTDISDPGCVGGKFIVLIVSSKFEGKPLVQRHRLVNSLLQEELKGDIHALSMKTLTPEQWKKQQQS